MLEATIPFSTNSSTAVDGQIASVVTQLAPITLKELQAADSTLMDRIDTKFTLTTHQLAAALNLVTDTYQVLTIEGVSLQHYHTLYFDTPELLFYQQHHNGYRNRYKVRLRTYLDSKLSFLEVKLKNNKDRTIKNRMKIPLKAQQLSAEMQTFLRTHIPVAPESLTPQLVNTFTRLTLVNKHSSERVTIDFDLRFEESGGMMHYPHLVIAEVKQPRFTRQSPIVQALHTLHSQEMGFSKYCIGVALGHQDVKRNCFKPALLQIERYH